MWCVLYGWTPEIFTTAVRGTAYGTAGALSRMYVLLPSAVQAVFIDRLAEEE